MFIMLVQPLFCLFQTAPRVPFVVGSLLPLVSVFPKEDRQDDRETNDTHTHMNNNEHNTE